MKRIILIASIVFCTNSLFSQQTSNEDIKYYGYGELVVNETPKPKHVQIKPIKLDDFEDQSFSIETLGYSEIRIFAELFKNDYKKELLPKNSKITLILVNEITGLGSPFKTLVFENEVGSMIDVWAIEKIYGRKTKIIVMGENIPKGKYTFHFSYYLLP